MEPAKALIKVLAHITEPTEKAGFIEESGQLLEVGTGFHPGLGSIYQWCYPGDEES
jgi:hypothetical protein